MMERHFDISLRQLKENLLIMAGYVERQIEFATEALTEASEEKLNQIYELEKKVNQCHIDVDDGCVKLLALQQPLAQDLRLIISILKINTDLERMGDQAVNIAHNSEYCFTGKPLKITEEILKISKEVCFMVRESLDSFVKGDRNLADDVLSRDDTVDQLKDQVLKTMITHLKTNPQDISRGITLILIARNLERIGDHATNIAEDVIYVLTGKDIRHAAMRA